MLALAADQPEIADPVLERSPLLVDADLVDRRRDRRAGGAGRDRAPRAAAARRSPPPSPRSARRKPASMLIENPDAEIAPFSLDRIVERHGHLAAIREALLARDDLPAATRQALVAKLSRDARRLRRRARTGSDGEHARTASPSEACEKATVALAAETPASEVARR